MKLGAKISIGTLAGAAVIAVIIFLFFRRMKKKSYFTIEELSKTSQPYDNTPTAEARGNLQQLIDNVLDPLREAYGQPIYVSSGYRSPQVNAAVGGVLNSQHMKGQAADIYTKDGKGGNKRLFDLIIDMGNFDQVIDEKNYQWVHVSYNKSGNRGQVLHL